MHEALSGLRMRDSPDGPTSRGARRLLNCRRVRLSPRRAVISGIPRESWPVVGPQPATGLFRARKARRPSAQVSTFSATNAARRADSAREKLRPGENSPPCVHAPMSGSSRLKLTHGRGPHAARAPGGRRDQRIGNGGNTGCHMTITRNGTGVKVTSTHWRP
jgi:hypothetical protein